MLIILRSHRNYDSGHVWLVLLCIYFVIIFLIDQNFYAGRLIAFYLCFLLLFHYKENRWKIFYGIRNHIVYKFIVDPYYPVF